MHGAHNRSSQTFQAVPFWSRKKKVGQKSEWDLLESNFPLETFSTSWAVTLLIFCPSPAEQLLPLLSHGKKKVSGT